MTRRNRPARTPKPVSSQVSVNPKLYAMCRAGTDPAITRALEDASDPWSAVKKAMAAGIDWDAVDDIAAKLTEARQ